MKVFNHWLEFQDFNKTNNQGIIGTIGNFDGIHLGHKQLIDCVIKSAAELNLRSAVISFYPNTKLYFNKRAGCFLITNQPEQISILSEFNIDYLIYLPFDEYLKNLDARGFIQDILINSLRIKKLVIGKTFYFGNAKSGDKKLLEQYQDYFDLKVIESLTITLENTVELIGNESSKDEKKINYQTISSTNVRLAIQSGDLDLANKLLGHDYNIIGSVIHGKKRAQTIGFPTANIRISNDKILLPYGVYKVMIDTVDSNLLKNKIAIANIGVKPTFEQDLLPILEVHIPDFYGDLYDQRLNVKFVKFIRKEKKFDSINELKEQIKNDILELKDNLY